MLRRGSWYKRHFRERKEKVFEILGGETLLVGDWKCGGILSLSKGSTSRERMEQENRKKKKETFWGKNKRFLARKIEKEERERDSHLKLGRSCWTGALIGMTVMNPCSSSLSYVFPFLLLHLWIIWLGMDVRRYGFIYVNFRIACELIFCWFISFLVSLVWEHHGFVLALLCHLDIL